MEAKRIQQIRKKSKKQESCVAKAMQGKTVVASGALYFAKADVKTEDYLIECKTTEKPYYNLAFNTWKKIKKEALHENMRIPLMHIQLNDGDVQLCILSIHDLMALEIDNLPRVVFSEGSNPRQVDKKSARIYDIERYDTQVLKHLQLVAHSSIVCYRYDINFTLEHEHLVILDWDDFQILLKLKQEQSN